ncbi:Tetratricopeptide repeat protein [Sulfidibacter corallicola]|uniref:Tetratricopeptide repeat protein n=1 Tax=Sulfidibacter corallicola TaxID=2818388 RepID=A0A8A4U2A6_SULCO|nr:tetratricopeptide repeat protein [Sulfidibacter corallicola]QTD52865.1 tetratricopeptide repeat protein [Sulfidibacter corallicola]
MRIALVLTTVLALTTISCGPKKQTQAEIEKAEAEYNYQEALKNYKIGVNYLNNNEVLQAIQHLETAVNQDDTNFRYRHGLGLAFSMNGQLEEAESELNRALAINPNHSESYNLLGSVYIDQERYIEAVEVLKKVIRDKNYGQPQFPYFNLGLAMRRQDRLTEAVAAFQKVVQIDPSFYRAYIALADIYKQNGDYDHALYFYQKAEPGFTNDVSVLYEIGHALFKLKRYDQAKTYLAQVSILFPPPVIDKPTQEMLRYIEMKRRKALN